MLKFKTNIMKNSAKTGLLILSIAMTALACDPSKGAANKPPEDSGKVKADYVNKKIDSAQKTTVDTAKKDTAKKD
jgi:hypothetical protein